MPLKQQKTPTMGKSNETTDPATPPTYAKAPRVTVSLYDEAVRTLYPAIIVKGLTMIIRSVKEDDELDLVVPEGFPEMDLEQFLDKSMDLTGDKYNNGNGVSFKEIDDLLKLEHNKEVLQKLFDKDSAQRVMVEKLRNEFEKLDEAGGEHIGHKTFLTHHRSIQREVACVYSVVKDTSSKRIIVAFRGTSPDSRDWSTNLNATLKRLETPVLVRDKMEGRLKERVLVHHGFHDYLFDNEDAQENGHDVERFDKIVSDIKAAINGEEGYSVYITGHSLGGALATMLSFKLAGADGPEFDAIPRPITCISWAAPMSGTTGTRTATEHMEKMGLLRSLRMCHPEDIVPTVPFLSFLRTRLMKHVGINVRLSDSSIRIEHSSKANFATALRNSIFKPFWQLPDSHFLPTYEERFADHANELKTITLDDLYTNTDCVSAEFAKELSFEGTSSNL
jgi:predicted esterase YcpF (UPF0227 family)